MPDSQHEGTETRDDRLQRAVTDILEILYRAYPSPIWTGYPGPLADLRHRIGSARLNSKNDHGEQLWDEALGLLASAWVRFGNAAMGDVSLEILPEGIRELAKRRGMTTVGDLANLKGVVMEAIAGTAEVINKNRAEQEKLRQQVTRFERRLANAEKNFYSSIFPFLAVFVAAFALIITGAQGVFHITASDPVMIFWQAAAIMGPILIVNVVLVLFAWLISRWH